MVGKHFGSKPQTVNVKPYTAGRQGCGTCVDGQTQQHLGQSKPGSQEGLGFRDLKEFRVWGPKRV